MKYKFNNLIKGTLTSTDCEVGDFIVFRDKETNELIDITIISTVDPENTDDYLENDERFKLVSLGKQSDICRGQFNSIKELVDTYTDTWDDLNYRIIKSDNISIIEINNIEGDF